MYNTLNCLLYTDKLQVLVRHINLYYTSTLLSFSVELKIIPLLLLLYYVNFPPFELVYLCCITNVHLLCTVFGPGELHVPTNQEI